jgi:hypothetical protein
MELPTCEAVHLTNLRDLVLIYLDTTALARIAAASTFDTTPTTPTSVRGL